MFLAIAERLQPETNMNQNQAQSLFNKRLDIVCAYHRDEDSIGYATAIHRLKRTGMYEYEADDFLFDEANMHVAAIKAGRVTEGPKLLADLFRR